MVESIHTLLGNCKPVSEDELNKVFDSLCVKLNEIGLKFAPIGSFNKKKEGSLYNDLDIAVEAPFKDGIDIVKQICQENEDKTIFGKYNDKFNTVSIGYKLRDETNLQVDFMFVENIEFAKFAFHSPNFKLNESKYKGMYASILLQSIIRNIPVHKEYFEDGNVKEWIYFSLSQREGLIRKHKSFIGKRGNRVKSPQLVEETFISDDPKFIINLIFKNQEVFNYIYTFEGLLDYISKNYDKEFIERVKHDFLTDWEFELKTPDELKKEFEDLFNDKINNL